MQFSELGLAESILRAVGDEGYQTPTPIQALAIPHVLAGRDLFGCAQTGTGKTAAFAMPIIQRLADNAKPVQKRGVRALVLSPTRELAAQIGESFAAYGRHSRQRYAVVFGGVGIGRQIQTLSRGVDVLVATPGRLLDLMSQRAVSLADVQIFVLDEADRMLDLGFVNDVKIITKALPLRRQTLMFSATLPDSIKSLAQALLSSPIQVAATPVSSAAENLEQSVYFVDKGDKQRLLSWVLRDASIDRALAFTRTKHGANRVVAHLAKSGISADAIHGNKSQNARQRALEAFKQGQLRVLVATDIAARGIDIEQLSCVINFDLPNVSETYVHRIGRTARAGSSGVALSFCDNEERTHLRNIERLIRQKLIVVDNHPHPPNTEPRPPASVPRAQPVRVNGTNGANGASAGQAGSAGGQRRRARRY